MKTNINMQKQHSKNVTQMNEIKNRLMSGANLSETNLYQAFHTSEVGLTETGVELSQKNYGRNVVSHNQKESIFKKMKECFLNPFTAILLMLAFVSVFTDIVLAKPGQQNYVTIIIITVMVLLSGILRLVQETKSDNASEKLTRMIKTTTCVERVEVGKKEIALEEVVVGDIVYLSAGDMIPADIRILMAKDLFISQSALTGESEPVEKHAMLLQTDAALTEVSNLAFMGSNVISGSAKAMVLAVGKDTLLGNIANELDGKEAQSSFEKGITSVSYILIRFMLVMVPVVLFLNGFTNGDWLNACLFAISIAVGLTPEMLPMIITTSLAKGAVAMSHKKVIIKNLPSIQNLGSMDILCTDKTGTLTQDKVVLEYHLDIHGKEDNRVLRHAFLNSYYQTGLKNLIDLAIIAKQQEVDSSNIEEIYAKVDEIPFDFNRRRMSVVVLDQSGKTQMITKGAVEEMLSCCSYAEYNQEVTPLTQEIRAFILRQSDELNEMGMRVIAVAHKTNPAPAGQFSIEDEKDMVLIGFLAFLDPPKETTADAILALKDHGVMVKILTGDNEKVTRSICHKVGLEVQELMLGPKMDELTDQELFDITEKTTIFAKLSPSQKARIIRVLMEGGHCVGYMGDGINDALAMKESDVGISVDTAVDIARESADVILLNKDLMVLEEGILEGRKTYANMIKYIKMTASSNFGNIFSVLVASAFLPFLPMAAIHLIILNLIYDITCISIPWDHVDEEYLKRPHKWEASSVSKFMLWFGPVSSIFDIGTYLLMYFVICPVVSGGQLFNQITDPSMRALYIATFQAGWFVESMWSQTLVIHMIRTKELPFIKSRASKPVLIFTFTGIAALTAIPFTSIGSAIGLASLPASYFIFLLGIILSYMVLVTVLKNLYVRRYGELL